MKTIRRIASIIVMSALCFAARSAVAADYSLNHGSGERTLVLAITSGHQFSVDGEGAYDRLGDITVTGGTLNIVFNTTDYINLAGRFKVNQGTLHLSLGAGYTTGHPTLMRASGYTGEFFYVDNNTLNASDCQLIIQGEAGKDFIMDGGCKDFNIVQNADGTYNATYNQSTSVTAQYPLVLSLAGVMDFDHVVMRNNYNSYNGNQINDKDGGAIYVRQKGDSNTPSANSNESGHVITMDYCTIDSCYSECSGAALRVRVNNANSVPHSLITMNNCEVNYCYSRGAGSSQGGIIRTWGASRCGLSMTNCMVHNNYNYDSNALGIGMIHWNAFDSDTLRMNNCVFDANWNRGDGGAINVVSKAKITGCQITNNRSEQNGGGLCYTTYNSNLSIPGLVVGNSDLSLDSTTVVEGNSAALNGGGLWIRVRQIIVPGAIIPDDISVNLNVNGATIRNNSAQNGGGVFMTRTYNYHTDINLNYGRVTENHASQNGGGIYAEGGVSVNVGMGSAAPDSMNVVNNTAVNGGGLYLADGDITIKGGNIGLQGRPNVCTDGDGGGVFVQGGRLTMYGGGVNYNEAVYGGGICLDSGNIVYNSGVVQNNSATMRGGGIYISGGNFTMHGGTIGGDLSQGNKTTNSDGFGGGLYMDGGVAVIDNGAISGNEATSGFGGGVFMNSGSCTLLDGATIGGTNSNFANNAQYGGGIYSAGGVISVEGGVIAYNTAFEGGGIYSNGLTAEVYVKQSSAKDGDRSRIQFNSAERGGGIYAEKGFVEFSDGIVRLNYASVAGGGMYIDTEGSLLLKGNSLLERNHVPTDCHGGGVYLLGTVTVGDESGAKDANAIKAEDNFAYTTDAPGTVVVTKYNRNNIYLPNPIAMPDASSIHRDVITVVENGIGLDSKVGFTVPRNLVPVIYCRYSPTSRAFLDRFTTGLGHDLQTVLFDDTEKYISIHKTDWTSVFDPDHVYLYGFWPEAVTSEPDGFSIDNIDSEEDFAWLITLVNGRLDEHGNVEIEPSTLEGTTITLTADLDMSEFGWVPIGETNVGVNKNPFKGTFQGNGHTIAGIITMVYKEHSSFGLFGNADGAVIKDVFLDDALFLIENTPGIVVGSLVGDLHGDAILSNSGASANITAQGTNPLIGGVVGRMGYFGEGTPEVHSICAMADMTGGNMGGIVGEIVKGNLFNSYAYPKFTSQVAYLYYGGLVGINAGTVANCYVRLRGDMSNPYFGKFVGQHKVSGNLNYCYAPGNYTELSFWGAKADGSVFANYRNYDYNAVTPYLYLHRDVQVHVVNGDSNYIPTEPTPDPYPEVDVDKQMLLCLNNWVNEKNGSASTYTSWIRPMTTVINGDYPILRMPSTNAVACSGDANGGESEILLHYAQINDLIAAYPIAADTASICLYRSSNDSIISNAASGAKLYIAEGVSVIQKGPLKAYVGVTLDNSAGINGAHPTFGGGMTDITDWHMFSSPLAYAPLAVKYVHSDGTADSTQYLFSYDHSSSASGDPMPYYQFYDESERDGYFPSHVYGKSYIENDNVTPVGVNGENYYQEWDYYTYYEPEYHWVNFKRNSNSHWHEDGNHDNIAYQNEEYLIVGRGYLLATRHPTYLQCYGTLNGSEPELTIPVTYNNHFSAGYNLLGNPYLAYLDFNKFAELNKDDLQQCDSTYWCYAVLDEDPYVGVDSTYPGGYKYYAYNCSVNPEGAPRYIAPHQGFMIQLACEATDVAFFTPDMRSIDGDGGHFRDAEQPAYPLVNLLATDANGNRDITTVELSRPDQGGAPLMRDLKLATCHVWCHYEDRDWAIAFTKPGLTEVPIRFEAYENGEYTMTWNTQNGAFSYLHLIDNMTGVDVDCLAETSYRFEARTSDYRSRFRLLFGYTGIDENQEGGDQPISNFAYQSDEELVVNGEGTLRMFDVTGRQVMSGELQGAQTVMPLPDISVGVYLLRLDTVNGTRTQKIVIK